MVTGEKQNREFKLEQSSCLWKAALVWSYTRPLCNLYIYIYIYTYIYIYIYLSIYIYTQSYTGVTPTQESLPHRSISCLLKNWGDQPYQLWYSLSHLPLPHWILRVPHTGARRHPENAPALELASNSWQESGWGLWKCSMLLHKSCTESAVCSYRGPWEVTVNLDKGQLVTVQSFPTGYPGKKKWTWTASSYNGFFICSTMHKCLVVKVKQWYQNGSVLGQKKTILQDFEIFACTTLSHLPWTDHWQAVEWCIDLQFHTDQS